MSKKKRQRTASPDRCLLCKGPHHDMPLPADSTKGPGWDDLRTAAMKDCMWHIAIGAWKHAKAIGLTDDQTMRVLTDPKSGVMVAATYLAAGMHAHGRTYAMQESLAYATEHVMAEFWGAILRLGGPGQYVFELRADGTALRVN